MNQYSTKTTEWNLFKVPQTETSGDEGTVIGILDSSGSMEPYWPVLSVQYNTLISKFKNVRTITFDTSIHQKDHPKISNYINDHGGGGTNISNPFTTLNEIIKQGQIKTQNLTVILVSDGADYDPNSLEKRLQQLKETFKLVLKTNLTINFLCVAIGTGFPTFIAMRLRELYHSGDSSTPSLFLIENTEAFAQQFDNLLKYVGHQERLSISPSIFKFPWDQEKIDFAYANSWVCSQEENKIKVQALEQIIYVDALKHFTIYELIEIAKEWVQFIQLLSLKDSAVSQAKVALEIITQHQGLLNAEKQLQKKKDKPTFADRVKLREVQNNPEQDLNMLIKELRKIVDNELLTNLSQEEAAKRLAIGTIVGKHHNVAVKLRGLSVDDYTQSRDYFIKTFQQSKINLINSKQEPSIISMQNFKDVLAEPDMIDGLQLCPSQYDLVETFPIVGLGIQVKRIDGSMINPWMIQVLSFARHHSVIDSLSLQQKGNSITLNTGEGETEVINCVLPLFDDLDADLQPILRSKLYHILMTFNVMQNADTCFETAYAALLANGLVYLLQQPSSSWRDELMTLIHKTYKLVYHGQKKVEEYRAKLISDPTIAVVTEHPEIDTKCEDLSKPILFLFDIVKNAVDVPNLEKMTEIISRVICEQVCRAYPPEESIHNFFEITNKDELLKLDCQTHVERLILQYTSAAPLSSQFYTLMELKNDLQNEIAKIDLKSGIRLELTLDRQKLYFLKGKLSLDALNLISNHFVGIDINQNDLICYLFHGQKFRNSYDRAKTPINKDIEFIFDKIKAEKLQSLIQTNTILRDTYEKLSQIQIDEMQQTHFDVSPMTQEDINKYCQQTNKDSSIYQFNTYSNLLKNACMAPQCPHYMVSSQSLAQHFSGIRQFPAYHKTIQLNLNAQDEQIYEFMLSGKCLDNQGNAQFDVHSILKPEHILYLKKDKERILKNIHDVKLMYQKQQQEQQ